MQQGLQITSDWTPADDTHNCLEVAKTSQPGVIAIRDTYDPNRQITATTKQLLNLANAAQSGRFRGVVQ
jgi:Domain of unknown function (DUF397)